MRGGGVDDDNGVVHKHTQRVISAPKGGSALVGGACDASVNGIMYRNEQA